MITVVQKKFRTLILPYILTSFMVILSSIFWNILRGLNGSEIYADAINWFFAALYGSGTITKFLGWHFRIIGAIWFLLAMFWADIIFNIILLRLRYVSVCVLVISFIGYITTEYIWLPLSFQTGLTAMLFVWIGYKVRQLDLLNKYKDNLWCLLFALALWLNSIVNGGELYMVRNYYGNGVFDILGAIGAVFIIIKFAGWISKPHYLKRISDFLSMYGRNSLIVLCIHLIELDTFPWYVISNRLPYALGIVILFVLKVMLSLVGVWGVRKVELIRLDVGENGKGL